MKIFELVKKTKKGYFAEGAGLMWIGRSSPNVVLLVHEELARLPKLFSANMELIKKLNEN